MDTHMKRIALLFLFLLLLPSVSAYNGLGFYGQNQYYYVVFDGEGEAAVVARIEIQNTENLSQLDFSIPGTDADLINIVQEWYSYQRECVSWEELSCSVVDGVETCVKDCIEYGRYPLYPPKYAEVTYTQEQDEDSLNVHVDIPYADQDNLYIIAYYKSSDYVTQRGGVYHYSFETVEDQYDTNTVRVSIDVAEDLYLQGVRSAIQYREEISKAVSADLALFAPNIPYIDTGYTETASSLDPYETFTVDGKYAKSWWNVHWWKVLLGVLAVVGLIGGLVYWLRHVHAKNKKLGLALFLGISSSILLWLIWLATAYFMESYMYWGYYSSSLYFFVILLVILMSAFLLIVPSVMIGIKEGINYGLYCFIATVLSLFILSVITIVVFLIFFRGGNGPPIIYSLFSSRGAEAVTDVAVAQPAVL